MPNAPAGFNAAVLQGDLRFGQGGITVDDLSGVFLRSITDNGNNTYDIAMQGTDGTDTTVTITATGGGGASITSGTADPTGGAAGDAYIQLDASDVIQSIWRNVSGTWTEYTLPAGVSGGFTLHGGSGAPAASLGDSGDWYLRFSNGQWYEKVNTTWHGRYTPPQLSDVAPLATSTSADEGTGLASSREDHIHVGLALGNQEAEDTGNAAETGTRGFASHEDHVHAIGYGTGNVESVGTANAAGSNAHPARRDHVHDGGTAGGGPDLSDTIPPSIGADGTAGTDDDASRADHTHGGQRAVSDNTPEDVGNGCRWNACGCQPERPRAWWWRRGIIPV